MQHSFHHDQRKGMIMHGMLRKKIPVIEGEEMAL